MKTKELRKIASLGHTRAYAKHTIMIRRTTVFNFIEIHPKRKNVAGRWKPTKRFCAMSVCFARGDDASEKN